MPSPTQNELFDQAYIRRELFKARPLTGEDQVRMKLAGEHGESRWVSLPEHVRDLVTAVASLTKDQAGALENVIRLASAGKRGYAQENVLRMGEVRDLLLGLDNPDGTVGR